MNRAARGRGANAPRFGWAAYAAAIWALIFALFHIIWAFGWYVGLNAEEARVAFARPVLYAYDVVVAGMCLVAVPVALAIAQPWGRRVPRRLVGFFVWTGTGLLVLRSVASIIQVLYLAVAGQFPRGGLGLWEPWFYLGAILWSLVTWRFWRAREPAGAASTQA